MIAEVSKDFCRKYFRGNVAACITAGCYLAFTPEFIKAAFSCGRGTWDDARRYMEANRPHCYYVELEAFGRDG